MDPEKAVIRMENLWKTSEQRIMEDIIRRIRKESAVTMTADYQINRLLELGKSTEEVEKIIKDTTKRTWPEMFELYDNIANEEYVRNENVYLQINDKKIPEAENRWKIQMVDAIKKQTKEQFENLSQSLGFSVIMGNKRVFLPYAEYWKKYVDAAMMDIVDGGMDYSRVIRRVVDQMTASGIRTVDYASGKSTRVDVAARRAIMTGYNQIVSNINQRNAELLGTEYFEVAWHPGARPSHQDWQGKVYHKDDLVRICGLGTAGGLCGVNCRHVYFPFIKGVSKRRYTDEWLAEQNAKEAEKKYFFGKGYDAYGQTQKMRSMERVMRAQREKVYLMKKAGADEEEITVNQVKYQAQLNEYSYFCKKMGLEKQRERIYYDMRGRIALQYQKEKKAEEWLEDTYGEGTIMGNVKAWEREHRKK